MNRWEHAIRAGCIQCSRDLNAEFWDYFKPFHAPGIAERMAALREHRYLDYAKLTAPQLAKTITEAQPTIH